MLKVALPALLGCFLAACATNTDVASESNASSVVAAPGSIAAVKEQWRLTESAVSEGDSPSDADASMTGFLEPQSFSAAPTTEDVKAFLADRVATLFGDFSGPIGHVNLEADGAFDDVAPRFSGRLRVTAGLFAMKRWVGVADAVHANNVQHAWAFHGQTPVSMSDILVVQAADGTLYGFVLAIVG